MKCPLNIAFKYAETWHLNFTVGYKGERFDHSRNERTVCILRKDQANLNLNCVGGQKILTSG